MEIRALQKLCLECKDIDVELDKVKEKSKELNVQKSELRKQILEHLEENGLERFDFGDGKVSISSRRSVKLEDKYKFFGWLQEQGIFEDVITIHSATLNALYNKEYERAQESGDLTMLTDGLPGLSEPSVFRDIKFYKK